MALDLPRPIPLLCTGLAGFHARQAADGCESMKIIKNPLLGTWEMAESEGSMPSKNRSSRPCNPKCVLIVDDEEPNRRLHQTIIHAAFPAVQCEQASDGAQAVALFIARQPLVILMDVVMPVLDGEEAYYQIEEHCQTHNWKLPRVVFCTGHSPSVSLRNVVAGDPAHCLLQKPIRKRILVTAIAKRLGLRPIA